MTVGSEIVEHYSGAGLLDAIRNALAQAGIAEDEVTIDDLAPVDEFHIGGRPATRHLCEQVAIDETTDVLDVGCGIGGTARFLASEHGCAVMGIDLTPEYVEVARTLSAWTGLADRTHFSVRSALDTGFASESFDLATQVHVGMNIDDKRALFAEVHRVLRPGGRLAVYDIMRCSDGDISFPVPWASDASTSRVASLDIYRAALTAEGFEIDAEDDRGDAARDFFAGLQRRSAAAAPPVGLHLIMGTNAPVKIANMVAAVMAGTLAPTEIIARRVA